MGRLAIGWLAAAGAGCGTLGGDGGGANELPNRGIVPYEKVTVGGADAGASDVGADVAPAPGSPFVLQPEDPKGQRIAEPSAVVDGGRVVLFAGVRTVKGGATVIARAEAEDGVRFGPLETVLAAEGGPEWFGGAIGAPAVVRDGERWLMAFAVGDGAGIGLATSEDGVAFTPGAGPVLTAEGEDEAGGVGSPSLVVGPEGLVLFYEARREAGGPAHLRRASSPDGVTFTRDGAVLEGGVDCLDPQGEPETCWDAFSVETPEARLATTATGRRVWRLFYAGRASAKGKADLGFAASFDGLVFERYRFNPVLDDSVDERAPSNVLSGGRYLLYFAEDRSTKGQGVGLAIDDAGAPSERF